MKLYDWLGVDALSSNPSSDDFDVLELNDDCEPSLQVVMSNAIDPMDHVSTTYFMFCKETYEIILANLQTLKAKVWVLRKEAIVDSFAWQISSMDSKILLKYMVMSVVISRRYH